jgi:hypothetical protein
MDIKSEKLQLVRMLLDTQDIGIINKIKALFQAHNEPDFLDEMPKEIQDSLERSIQQSLRGETTSHEEIMKKYNAWLKR